MAWQWDRRVTRYRSTLTGRFVAERRLVQWRDMYVGLKRGSAEEITGRLTRHEITLQAWHREMRDEIRTMYTDLYLFGRGGKNAMQEGDWRRLEEAIQRQNGFLDNFARQMADGEVSPAMARPRARMYLEGATQAFEEGKAKGKGIPDLPQYPGDGQTQCRSNCQCHLEYELDGTEWLVTWHLGQAEHCPDCEALAMDWNPLRVQVA